MTDRTTPVPLAHCQVAILGAGRSLRGSRSSAMVDIDDKGRVMDWLLSAFDVLGNPQVSFVGGYQADQVIEQYPQVRPVFNRHWRTTGPAHSLALVPLDLDRELFVCYADVVFRPAAVAALRDAAGDVVLAIDSHWRRRYDGRGKAALEKAEKIRLSGGHVIEIGTDLGLSEASAEFAGLLKLSVAGVRALADVLRSGALPGTASMPDLLRRLLGRDLRVTPVDLAGEWAELDARQDLARFVLGTKAESLSRLSGMNHGGLIGPLVSFTNGEWASGRGAVIARILDKLRGEQLIIRSSAITEDGWVESAAGRHATIAPVERTAAAIDAAVDTVLLSYGRQHPDDQVLVQDLLRDVTVSGVVMTRAAALGSPYYVLNFDHGSRVGAVTSGAEARAIFLHRDAVPRPELPDPLGAVLDTVQRIETLVGYDSLDIEFAVTRDARVHVLQVRPIAVTRSLQPIDDELAGRALQHAARLLIERAPTPPNLVGRTTRYSVMADWNPAEIIGTTPRRLALSLYRDLITDEVWARQRAEYGFRDVRPCPLLVEICGHPYVDVRASFSSFIPAALGHALAGRLVDAYIARLAARPALHDKVEFDVAFTCLAADFDARAAERLVPAGFTDDEIGELRDALRTVTERGIGRAAPDLAGLADVDAAITAVLEAPLAPLDQAYHLIDVARRGTLAFAHLARSAFVATSLLRSFGAVGALSRESLDRYLGSIHTVFSQIRSDGARVASGELTWDAYVDRYGHLRPGTYDITSSCYRAAAERYLRPLVARGDEPAGPAQPQWHAGERRSIEGVLRRLGLTPDVDRFDAFARAAIAGREQGKFVFTRALSAALECLAAFGASNGFTRADLSHVPIGDLLASRDSVVETKTVLARRVEEGQDAYRLAQAICLPGQIAGPADLVCFEQETAEPNFITQLVVEGAVVVAPPPEAAVCGKIVLVPSADPGHDWLLARNIAGLITMYGGANSHIAVRAAEAGLPAAIGVGERIYGAIEQAMTIRLDCATRMISVVY